MEKKLKRLFDYQRFSNNKELQRMIDDALERYPEKVAITDEVLEFAFGGKKEVEEDIRKKLEDQLNKKQI